MLIKMKLMVFGLAIFSLLLPSAGCNQDKDYSTQISPILNQSLLFFQTISQGSYKDGVLSLEENLPQLVDYSDNSNHLRGYVTLEHFIKLWNQEDESFKARPPKAMFFSEKNEVCVMELSSPTMNNQTLKFNVKVLSGNLPAQFGLANLFIDAIPAPTLLGNASQTKVLGDAPAVAMGNLFIATSQALADAAHNAGQ